MTALSDAEQAFEEAREAAFREKTLHSLDRLIRAVRHHDAEVVRDLSRQGYSAQEAAKKIDPRETP